MYKFKIEDEAFELSPYFLTKKEKRSAYGYNYYTILAPIIEPITYLVSLTITVAALASHDYQSLGVGVGGFALSALHTAKKYQYENPKRDNFIKRLNFDTLSLQQNVEGVLTELENLEKSNMSSWDKQLTQHKIIKGLVFYFNHLDKNLQTNFDQIAQKRYTKNGSDLSHLENVDLLFNDKKFYSLCSLRKNIYDFINKNYKMFLYTSNITPFIKKASSESSLYNEIFNTYNNEIANKKNVLVNNNSL